MNEDIVKSALSKVIYPGFQKDIVSFGFVDKIEIDGADVRVEITITSSANEVAEEIAKSIDIEVSKLGAEKIDVKVNKPAVPRETSSRGKNIAPTVKNFVMVSSGKGGVGKSTTSVNLAIALAMQGKKVGLLDADIYGPNIPRMLGAENTKPEVIGNKVKPIQAYGIEMISMGSLMNSGEALIWRGSLIIKAIQQFLTDILWSDLDVLVIDMPPGTGDAQLTLAQSVPVTAGVTVTTPQTVALDDAERSLSMFKKLHIPIAGVVENMSGFICPETGKEYDIFGKGASEALAKKYDSFVLAEVPIEPEIRVGGDGGNPITYSKPDSEIGKRYLKAGERLWEEIEKINAQGVVSNEEIQPTSGVSACSTSSGSSSSHSSGGSCGCS
jgi:ATP-binding protein involved in chromosome partitioning